MHSGRYKREQGLARFARWFDTSGKTAAEWHHRNNRERPGLLDQARLDVVAPKSFTDITKFASARSKRTVVRARLPARGHST
jgi:hypothetical protein